MGAGRASVAFTRYTDSIAGGLWVHDVASGASRRVGPDVRVNWPTWSPDGSRIAYNTWSDSILEIGADGAGRTLIARGRTPAWGPGDRLAYEAADSSDGRPGTPAAIFVRSLGDGTTIQASPRDGGYYQSPTWSRDGQLAAVRQRFDEASGRHHQAVVIDPATQTTRVIFADSLPLTRVSWSPDGRHFVVTRMPCCSRQLWIVRVDGSRSWPITPGSVSQTRFYGHDHPAWSPIR